MYTRRTYDLKYNSVIKKILCFLFWNFQIIFFLLSFIFVFNLIFHYFCIKNNLIINDLYYNFFYLYYIFYIINLITLDWVEEYDSITEIHYSWFSRNNVNTYSLYDIPEFINNKLMIIFNIIIIIMFILNLYLIFNF